MQYTTKYDTVWRFKKHVTKVRYNGESSRLRSPGPISTSHIIFDRDNYNPSGSCGLLGYTYMWCDIAWLNPLWLVSSHLVKTDSDIIFPVVKTEKKYDRKVNSVFTNDDFDTPWFWDR